jgi:hypothetical protein
MHDVDGYFGLLHYGYCEDNLAASSTRDCKV